jgi:hypothetical protein
MSIKLTDTGTQNTNQGGSHAIVASRLNNVVGSHVLRP